jgi:hypothetical protein
MVGDAMSPARPCESCEKKEDCWRYGEPNRCKKLKEWSRAPMSDNVRKP